MWPPRLEYASTKRCLGKLAHSAKRQEPDATQLCLQLRFTGGGLSACIWKYQTALHLAGIGPTVCTANRGTSQKY